jgi:hypothetical protein
MAIADEQRRADADPRQRIDMSGECEVHTPLLAGCLQQTKGRSWSSRDLCRRVMRLCYASARTMVSVLASLAILLTTAFPIEQAARVEPGSIQVFIVDESKTERRKFPGWEGRVLASQDLANALALQKDSPIRLVRNHDEANVVLEITDRFPKETGPSTGPTVQMASTIPLTHTVALGEWNIEAVATSGRTKARFVGSGSPTFKDAAAALAREIETWCRQNAERILPGRSIK